MLGKLVACGASLDLSCKMANHLVLKLFYCETSFFFFFFANKIEYKCLIHEMMKETHLWRKQSGEPAVSPDPLTPSPSSETA